VYSGLVDDTDVDGPGCMFLMLNIEDKVMKGGLSDKGYGITVLATTWLPYNANQLVCVVFTEMHNLIKIINALVVN
jgi:hypothetical protein